MRDLDATTFESAIAGGPLLVDFWAPWCRPCKALEPVLAELEATIPVARVNVDDSPSLGARYDVLSIPTVILFAGGERLSSIVGIRPRAHFDKWLAEALSAEVLPAAEIEVDA
jgi:thioredoxin 1